MKLASIAEVPPILFKSAPKIFQVVEQASLIHHRDLRFIRSDGILTVAAMLLFGKYTQRWMPMIIAKCICFAGNSVGNKVFRDNVNDGDMEGNLLHQYDTIMDFGSPDNVRGKHYPNINETR